VAPPGRVLLSADYGQLELRLMAHFSADERLVRMLSDPAQDPFTLYASEWLHTSQAQACLICQLCIAAPNPPWSV